MKKILSSFLSTIFIPKLVKSHGALSTPPARQWLCSGGATPNMGVQWNGHNGPYICQPDVHFPFIINTVITDWSGVNQLPNGRTDTTAYQIDPRKAHMDIMGDIGTGAYQCETQCEKKSKHG